MTVEELAIVIADEAARADGGAVGVAIQIGAVGAGEGGEDAPASCCPHGVRLPNECKVCADEVPADEAQRWVEQEMAARSRE